jgi:HK97 family phage portal protein
MIPDNEALQRQAPTGLAARAKAAIDVYGSTGSGLQALTSFVFPALGMSSGGGFWGLGDGRIESGYAGIEPRDFPYENVNAYNSSVVMACINAIIAGFKQAPPKVFKRQTDGTKVELPEHRLVKLLRRPNPFYSRAKLFGAALMSYLAKGNGYIYKDKADGGVGATRALYYIPHFAMIPRRPFDGSTFVGWYEYNVNGRTFRLRPDQVIHLRWELDPYNTLLGMSPLQPVLSTIFSDEEADRFTSALLRNTAIPGTIIAPDTEKVRVKPADAEAIKENFKRKFGGDKRGETLVLSFAAKIEQMGFNPEQLQMKDARRLPEERVSAQYRIAASFAGLGAGLDRSTFSNYEQAERKSYETGIVPLWDEFGEELSTAFNSEFFAEDESYSLEFDYTKVKALKEAANDVATRSSKIWQLNGMDRAEYRQANGLPVDEGRDVGVFFVDTRPAPVAPNPLTGGVPPALNGNGTKPKSFRDRITAALRLKAAPSATLDNAYDMMLEGDVTDAVRLMSNDLEDLYRELGEEAEKAARSMDKDNPQAESLRITEDIFKAVGLVAALAAIWGLMSDGITDGAKTSVALRLAVDMGSVWNEGAEAGVKSALRQSIGAYEASLRDQTSKAIIEAIKGAEAGESVEGIARTIKGMVSGRSMYPGIYEEAVKAAKAAGANDEQAAKAGESKARAYRAKLIAETETRTYQNSVLLESMLVSGVVNEVRVEDGGACGWRYHDDTDKANGTTRLLSEARRYPIVHPNCKRRFYPVKA